MGTGQVLINIPDLERTGPRQALWPVTLSMILRDAVHDLHVSNALRCGPSQAVCNTIEGLVSMRMVPQALSPHASSILLSPHASSLLSASHNWCLVLLQSLTRAVPHF